MNFVYEEETPQRLDVYLASVTDLSRSQIQKLATDEKIRVNDKLQKSNFKLSLGDIIEVTYMESVPSGVEAENIPINIVYEDEDLLVVDKPKGMSVHPAPGSPNHTLVNALLYHSKFLSSIGGEERPGIVHRLDKNTSGLLVVAKNDKCHKLLSEALQRREISRKYKALVWGVPSFLEAKVDMPIGRDPKDRKKMAVISDEELKKRDAVTHIKVLKTFSHFSLLECVLETGRTHQIRVHLSYIGFPVVGDEEYKGVKKKLPFQMGRARENEYRKLLYKCEGQLLHAYEMSFVHPINGERMTFSSSLPDNFVNMLNFVESLD